MAPHRAQLNVLVEEQLLDEMAAAVHHTSTLDEGPHDLASLTANAIRAELDRLAAELRNGEPWDIATGARIRTGRRRRRS